jgi:hypothetical protein
MEKWIVEGRVVSSRRIEAIRFCFGQRDRLLEKERQLLTPPPFPHTPLIHKDYVRQLLLTGAVVVLQMTDYEKLITLKKPLMTFKSGPSRMMQFSNSDTTCSCS